MYFFCFPLLGLCDIFSIISLASQASWSWIKCANSAFLSWVFSNLCRPSCWLLLSWFLNGALEIFENPITNSIQNFCFRLSCCWLELHFLFMFDHFEHFFSFTQELSLLQVVVSLLSSSFSFIWVRLWIGRVVPPWSEAGFLLFSFFNLCCRGCGYSSWHRSCWTSCGWSSNDTFAFFAATADIQVHEVDILVFGRLSVLLV